MERRIFHSPGGRCNELEIVYTSRSETAEAWLAAHVQRGDVVGFDAEWKPVFRAGEEAALGTLQVAAPYRGGAAMHVLILQVSHLPLLQPEGGATWAAICAAEVTGMSVGEDVSKVAAFFCARRAPIAVELKRFGQDRGVAVAGGLLALAQLLLGVDKWKSRKLQMSNWTRAPLTDAQLVYAAMDSWASLQCYIELSRRPLLRQPQPSPPRAPEAHDSSAAAASDAARLSGDAFRERFRALYGASEWVHASRIGVDVPRGVWPEGCRTLRDAAAAAGLEVHNPGDGALWLRCAPPTPRGGGVGERLSPAGFYARFREAFGDTGAWIHAGHIGAAIPRQSWPEGCRTLRDAAVDAGLEVHEPGNGALYVR